MKNSQIKGFKLLCMAIMAFIIRPTRTEEPVLADRDVTFELYNKDIEQRRVRVDLKVFGGAIVQGDVGNAQKPTKRKFANLYRAQIRFDDPSKVVLFLRIEHPKGNYEYTIRPGQQKVLLTFNPQKIPSVYPQTGKWKGLGGTESGLSLKNNLKASDIQLGDKRTTMEKLGSR